MEVRKGELNLTAEGRIEKNINQINAAGWMHDFKSVSCNLHLPPGWRLFFAKRVDRISNTWINKWSLFDIFLTLFIAAAMYKLMGIPAGITALITLTLVHTEFTGLSWVILILLGAIALNRVIPAGMFKNIINLCRRITLLGLILLLLPLIFFHIRNAVYPQLEGF